MKLKFSYLFLFMALSLMAGVAYAQEGSQGPEELVPPFVESSTKEDKPLIYEPEGKAPNNQQPVIVPSPTSKSKSKASDPSRSVATKTEDDALSFNFLLHIIQKFKSSDVIGQ